ncbi:hypothetical protein ABMZ07_29685 [Pseudomonas aeruginosa]
MQRHRAIDRLAGRAALGQRRLVEHLLQALGGGGGAPPPPAPPGAPPPPPPPPPPTTTPK